MYLYQKDVIEIEDDVVFNVKWMKHSNGYWYVSTGNPKRWHCLYSEDKQIARQNFFNGQYGPKKFLVSENVPD